MSTPANSSLLDDVARRAAFVGRQPIYDRELVVYGYELLFRRGTRNEARIVDGDEATFTVLVNALVEFGMGRLVGRHRAFINLTRNALLSGYANFFSPHQVVLEILEDVEPDAEVVAAVRAMKDKGFRIALDDCVWKPKLAPLLELADIIKIDVQAFDEAGFQEQVARFDGIELLAEKVETREQFELCKQLGVQYFQGYFISRPKVVSIEHVPSSRLSVLKLLSRVNEEGIRAEELAAIIGQDPGLAFRLLRSVNSAAYGLAVRVESISHAVMLLGVNHLRTWATLLALAGRDDMDLPILTTAILRAKTCENLAGLIEDGLRERAFMVGLFSLLDELMGMPLPRVLENMSLIDEVLDALLAREGCLGRILDCAIACERSEIDGIVLAGVELAAIQQAWLDAIAWQEAFREKENL